MTIPKSQVPTMKDCPDHHEIVRDLVHRDGV